MTDLFKYIVFAVGIIVVAMIFNFLRTQELAQAIVCTDGVISFLLHLVLWIFRNRVHEKFSVFVTAITILTTFQWALSIKLQLFAMEDNKVEQMILLKVSIEWLKQKAMVYAMF